tara:strand:+ start:1785 stop:2396 length:612 start_codon:yes stop_codon:yes gene_type:complete
MAKYTLAEVQAGIKFLQNANVSYEYDKDDEKLYFDIPVNKRIWTSGDSIWGNGKVVKGVKVSNLSLIAQSSKQMFAEEDWAMLKKEDLYWSGGLTGNAYYDGSGKDGTWYDGVDDPSALINRNPSKESDGLIYTDDGFVENLKKYMEEECDFNRKLLEKYLDFEYSEQGMQAEETVNFDVECDGDFWQHCASELVKFTATKVA